MGKGLKFLLIFFAVVVTIFILCRITNALNYFFASTPSNYPTIKTKEIFFASNLKKPKRFDFICYENETEEFGKQIWIHRLCGVENDKIEIKAGVLFVNDKNADLGLSLAHNYIVSQATLDTLKKTKEIDVESMYQIANEKFILSYSDEAIIRYKCSAEKDVKSKSFLNEEIKKRFVADWNEDNFGPIVVPANKYFVMGDNRSNALDSRYIGFIDKSKYVATILHKR
jgi:signal peptidase I